MRVVEGLGDARHVVQHGRRGQELVLRGETHEVVSVEQLHGDVADVLLLARVEDAHDAGVVQGPGRLRLAEKALLDLLHLGRAAHVVEHQGLDRDLPVDLGVLAQIDDAHRPAAQLLLDLVAAQGRLGGAAGDDHRAFLLLAPDAPEHGAVRRGLQGLDLGFDVLVFRIHRGDVLVRLGGLGVLPLALEIEAQVVEGVLEAVVDELLRDEAELLEGHVEHALPLEGEPEHLVGLDLGSLDQLLAPLGEEEALGDDHHVGGGEEEAGVEHAHPFPLELEEIEAGPHQSAQEQDGDERPEQGPQPGQDEHRQETDEQDGARFGLESPFGAH